MPDSLLYFEVICDYHFKGPVYFIFKSVLPACVLCVSCAYPVSEARREHLGPELQMGRGEATCRLLRTKPRSSQGNSQCP